MNMHYVFFSLAAATRRPKKKFSPEKEQSEQQSTAEQSGARANRTWNNRANTAEQSEHSRTENRANGQSGTQKAGYT